MLGGEVGELREPLEERELLRPDGTVTVLGKNHLGETLVLGLVVVALGFALRAAPLPGRLAAGIATLGLSSLAGLLYVIFIVAGLHGVSWQDPFGDIATVRWTPNIGIILAAAGCSAAFLAAILSFHHRD